MMKIKKPKEKIKEQELFNFFEWLDSQGYTTGQNHRLADTFHIPDKELDELYERYLKEYNRII